jgi:hypothetical protein
MATSLAQDLRRLKRLKDESSTANAKARAATEALNKFQAKVFARMEAEEVDSMKVSGRNFVRSTTEYASIQDRDAFLVWARENDHSLYAEREERRLLNQLVRERLDNGEELPPGIGFYVREIVSVKAA